MLGLDDLVRILIPLSPEPRLPVTPKHGLAKSGFSLTRNQSDSASFGAALTLVGCRTSLVILARPQEETQVIPFESPDIQAMAGHGLIGIGMRPGVGRGTVAGLSHDRPSG